MDIADVESLGGVNDIVDDATSPLSKGTAVELLLVNGKARGCCMVVTGTAAAAVSVGALSPSSVFAMVSFCSPKNVRIYPPVHTKAGLNRRPRL
jgi:hypothetical protein